MIQLKTTLNIFKKEFKTYFVSPIAYIVIGIFLIITGLIFFAAFFLNEWATLRDLFTYMPLTLIFVIPAITMNLFSEEVSVGSYELLLTLPVTFLDVIIGKFAAALVFACIAILPTFSYALFIGGISTLDWGPVIGGYIGAILLAAAYCAIGLLASAVTRKQIIAFIIGMGACGILWLLNQFISILNVSFVQIFQYISTDYHFRNIAKGVVDFRDVLYFLSLCFIALFITKLVMEEKK